MREEAISELRHLVEVIEQLRAPGGCPWDRDQTHESLAPFLLEETYEALDAIDRGSPTLVEELGDVLLQVVMHAAIGAERRDGGDGFDIGDVAAETTAKMIHRHPHVFDEAAVRGAADAVVSWEKLKSQERNDRGSVLDGVPAALPALARAEALQRRPARLGYEPTATADDALVLLRKAIDAVAARGAEDRRGAHGEGWVATDGGFARGDAVLPGDVATPADPRLTELVGELLFCVVTLARKLRVSPEDALRARAARFAQVFERVEARAHQDGADMHEFDAAEWERRWQEAGG